MSPATAVVVVVRMRGPQKETDPRQRASRHAALGILICCCGGHILAAACGPCRLLVKFIQSGKVYLVFCLLVFGFQACEISYQPGIEPT